MELYSDIPLKRRRLDKHTSIPTAFQISSAENTHIPYQAVISSPSPIVSLPLSIIHASTPQELGYAILTTDKINFTKQELLAIFSQIEKMYNYPFTDPCEYIN